MRVGIILTGDYGWAGGVYYSLNVIKLLQAISLSRPLKIVVIVNSSTPADLIAGLLHENTEVTFLDRKPLIYKIYHKVRGTRFIADINALRLDVIYPLIAYDPSHARLNCKCIYWLYDFQHKFLPELFSAEEIKKRDHQFAAIALCAREVVFSSYDSLDHYNRFFPDSKANKHVYNFVSLLDKNIVLSEIPIKIPDNYFIVCNQFWPHKNHLVVLKALKRALDADEKIHVVFTGKFDDGRNKNYVNELRTYIAGQHLEKLVTFTGFISRQHQVNLIVKARAIIQPSFFEGWSTVVEDAKALNKFLVLSDIRVSREQVKNNACFFEPTNDEQLAAILTRLYKENIIIDPLNYNNNIEASKNDLIKLFEI